jgi:hypothetical protein
MPAGLHHAVKSRDPGTLPSELRRSQRLVPAVGDDPVHRVHPSRLDGDQHLAGSLLRI